VTFDRVQHASDGKKYGSPDDHEEGVQQVDHYLKVRHYFTAVPYPRYFNDDFVRDNKLKYDYWEYDLAAWRAEKAGIDVGPDFVIEINGKKHDKKPAKIKDGIAKAYIEKEYPNTKFVRIDKLDTKYDSWLHKKLGI